MPVHRELIGDALARFGRMSADTSIGTSGAFPSPHRRTKAKSGCQTTLISAPAESTAWGQTKLPGLGGGQQSPGELVCKFARICLAVGGGGAARHPPPAAARRAAVA